MVDTTPSSKDEINIEGDCYHQSGPSRETCSICAKPFIEEPKIRCAECQNIILCPQCFSFGLETKNHRCDHPYHIDRRHISDDPDTDWSLGEDYDLLQALLDCGYGNDIDLGKRFLHRTVEEIRIRADTLLGLHKAPLLACFQVNPLPVIKYQPNVMKEEPPRYPKTSYYTRSVAGYSAPRGDFESEHANSAEEMLGELGPEADDTEDVPDELTNALACSIVECYNSVLRERDRRKEVIKEHGLLLKRSHFMLTNIKWPKILPFMQLLSGADFDSLIEGLNIEEKLSAKYRSLRRYRRLGITRLKGCPIFERLDAFRTKSLQDIKNVKGHCYPVVSMQKKRPNPLDVSQFDCYEHLEPKERDLCTQIRILPKQFLKFRKILIDANATDGGVRLKTARVLLKIDVNKTRQIYNFLRDEGFITPL